jgi:3-hydroxyacyl-CoA dehydrogenase/enoyl-CoA hydratase/3-hydroxybutyryl-CoA epimerase
MKDSKVNVLTTEIMNSLHIPLSLIEDDDRVNRLIFASKKPGIFIAGADINEIASIKKEGIAGIKSVQGQDLFTSISEFKFKTIALIDGVCLGGGLELALACDYRVVTENASLGLPEVSLGIIPGFGGTKRLPQVIPFDKAVTMITSGKPIDAKKALKYGLADFMLPSEVALEKVSTLSYLKKRRSSCSYLKRKAIVHIARKKILEKTKGHYKAPLVALDCIDKGYAMSMLDANQLESIMFAELAIKDESKNLTSIFLESNEMKSEKFSLKRFYNDIPSDEVKGFVDGRKIDNVGVLGCGVMGSGIAWNMNYRGYSTVMWDMTPQCVSGGLRSAKGVYDQLQKIRKISSHEVGMEMGKLVGTDDLEMLSRSDLVVEAIIENMMIKKQTFAKLEDIVSDGCILASNTSTLDIDEMSADLRHKDRFVGFHFFNPVNRMQLVEVIRGKHTSDETMQTMLDVAKRLKKIPVVVRNSPGFLVNRILIPYLNGACKSYGHINVNEIARYDKQFTDFGLPMGPFELMDTIGLDVCYHVAQSLKDFYENRGVETSKLFDFLYQSKLLGKKGGMGFYIYDGKKKIPNHHLKGSYISSKIHEKKEDDIIYLMKEEAELCLNERVVASQRDLDIALIYGIGYPPFRKSVLNYE